MRVRVRELVERGKGRGLHSRLVRARSGTFATAMRSMRISVNVKLRQGIPVLVEEFWKGESALIASSRVPIMKRSVTSTTKPMTVIMMG